jgi:outer membrane receptor protein involved in Fe transport
LGTDFFNENAEGLNLDPPYPSATWWTMANPDSITFDEYQLTRRVTAGFSGVWEATDKQRLSFNFYTRRTGYKEPVPSSVEHRNLTAPGGSVQFEADSGAGRIRNHVSTGVDLDGQYTTDFRRPNIGNAMEAPELVANATINQHRAGGYLTDRLTIGSKWTVLGGVRFDSISNQFTDKLKADGLDLSGSQNFTHATGRLGVSWNAAKNVGLFASWGQGFIPPATEELYANPAALGGFNQSLVPATSMGEEVGARGSAGSRVFWDVDFFRLDTKNDFERYRIDSRPLETFYGNAGESRRYGAESSIRWLPARHVTVTGAYTYAHFVYTKYDSLTYPGNLTGNSLPNCPRQQLYVEASYEFARTWAIGGGTQAFSRGFVDPTNLAWADGYALLNARFSKSWQHHRAYGTFFITGTNLTAKRYIAFTEPDPDGNSYQPGASRELFGGIQVRF